MKAPINKKETEQWRQVSYWILPDREWLEHQHIVLGKSTYKIACEIDAGHETVRRWLDLLGIERVNTVKSQRTLGAPRRRPDGYYWNPPSEEWLKYHYVTLDKTGREIADEVGATRPTVIAWLKAVGIPIRSHQREGQSERCFRERARKILEALSPPRCAICGRVPEERLVEVHHLDDNPWNNNPDNLQWLCRGCHTREHR